MAAFGGLRKTPRPSPKRSFLRAGRFGPCSKWWRAPPGNSALSPATGLPLRSFAADVSGDEGFSAPLPTAGKGGRLGITCKVGKGAPLRAVLIGPLPTRRGRADRGWAQYILPLLGSI